MKTETTEEIFKTTIQVDDRWFGVEIEVEICHRSWSEPDEHFGVCCSRRDGETTLRFGDMTVTDENENELDDLPGDLSRRLREQAEEEAEVTLL